MAGARVGPPLRPTHGAGGAADLGRRAAPTASGQAVDVCCPGGRPAAHDPTRGRTKGARRWLRPPSPDRSTGDSPWRAACADRRGPPSRAGRCSRPRRRHGAGLRTPWYVPFEYRTAGSLRIGCRPGPRPRAARRRASWSTPRARRPRPARLRGFTPRLPRPPRLRGSSRPPGRSPVRRSRGPGHRPSRRRRPADRPPTVHPRRTPARAGPLPRRRVDAPLPRALRHPYPHPHPGPSPISTPTPDHPPLVRRTAMHSTTPHLHPHPTTPQAADPSWTGTRPKSDPREQAG